MWHYPGICQTTDYRLSSGTRVDGDYSVGGLVFDGRRNGFPQPQDERASG